MLIVLDMIPLLEHPEPCLRQFVESIMMCKLLVRVRHYFYLPVNVVYKRARCVALLNNK